jgi:hypothetical protein
MKREAFNHPKMLDLATRLGVKMTTARGIVSTLWNWAADVAPQGDVGKWSDAVIAKALEHDGEPEALIEALVASGWVDRCSTYRLVIHDLEDHAPEWLKTKLKRSKRWFVSASQPAQCTGANARASDQRRPTTPKANALLTSANQTSANPTSDSPAANGRVFEDGVLTEEHLASPKKLRRWFDHDSQRPDRIVDGSEAMWRSVTAVVVKVNQTPKVQDRVALAKWIIKGRRWDYVPAMYDDIASRMLREQSTGPPLPSELAEIAATVLKPAS